MILFSEFFQFGNKCYQHIEGSPIGSPLSPIFAEFIIRDIEAQCLNKLKSSSRVSTRIPQR